MNDNATVFSVDRTLKDFYPRPGTAIKQYVVDTRRVLDWEEKTCPRISVPVHDDNCGCPCRNIGVSTYEMLANHDCCGECETMADNLLERSDIRAWHDELARRMADVCADRDKFSDQIEPDRSLRENPTFALLPRGKQ